MKKNWMTETEEDSRDDKNDDQHQLAITPAAILSSSLSSFRHHHVGSWFSNAGCRWRRTLLLVLVMRLGTRRMVVDTSHFILFVGSCRE